MRIILEIYFAINIFIVGHDSESYSFETPKDAIGTILGFVIALFFGAVLLIITNIVDWLRMFYTWFENNTGIFFNIAFWMSRYNNLDVAQLEHNNKVLKRISELPKITFTQRQMIKAIKKINKA